ncbi:MAG: DUF7487 domain-containing protein [bacterium]
MKKNIYNYFSENNKSGYKTRESWLKKNNIELYNLIIDFNNKNLISCDSFTQKIYNYIFNIKNIPECPTCKKKLKFKKRLKDGYQSYCSTKCTLVSEKTKQTNLKKYGVEYPLKSKIIREKAKQTNLKKFGVENLFELKTIQEKAKQTNLEKYGVENYSKTNEFKEKIKNYHQNYIKNKLIKILKLNDNDISVDIDNNIILYNQCNKHKEFKIYYPNLYDRIRLKINICTKCNPVSEQSSIKEKELIDFIKSLNINYIEKDRKLLNGKELDIYLLNHNLAIEFNGLYYHSELFKDKNYHLNKTEECEKKGVQLIHIFEDEWTYKKEIVKSIIKSKLGLIENKIYARKCIIKEIDSKQYKSFLDDNHIQGGVNTKIKIGLFYNGKLTSVMGFNVSRNSISAKENSYELNRFCNITSTNVIGGASKLLKYFINVYKPSEIISFADRRWSNGNLYEKLGFIRVKTNKPSYFYFKNNENIRYHRFNFRKENLIKMGGDINQTEHEIMLEKKYLKIYDCGIIKFKL